MLIFFSVQNFEIFYIQPLNLAFLPFPAISMCLSVCLGLSEPLVTFALHESFREAAKIVDGDESLSALYQCVSELPQPNRDTLGEQNIENDVHLNI